MEENIYSITKMNQEMNKELKLTDREWKAFHICNLFAENQRGNRLVILKREPGMTPFITAGKFNNGLSSFILNPSHRTFKKGITLDMFGNSFYQDWSFKCDDNITVLKTDYTSKYIHLFITNMLSRLREKYSYAKQVRPQRICRELLMLPIQEDGNPDWEFMEAYMRQMEKSLLDEMLPKLEQQLLENTTSLNTIEDREWKEFYFSDIFTKLKRGKRLKKKDHIEGTRPYVSSSANNNGVDNFIMNEDNVRIFKNCISLANSGSVGSAFFHSYSFVASDHVTILENEKLSRYVFLFMLPIISQLSKKYSFNREINDTRLNRERMMLPIQEDGTPDFSYMEQTMKTIEKNLILKYMQSMKRYNRQ